MICRTFSSLLFPLRCSVATSVKTAGFASRIPALSWQQNCWASGIANKQFRQVKRLEKLGIGPDGKPLPKANFKRVFPRVYKVLMVNQDGSTYTINCRHPYRIVTLPLDLSTLTPEQLAERERQKILSKTRHYVEEEGLEEDQWDQDQYRDLL